MGKAQANACEAEGKHGFAVVPRSFAVQGFALHAAFFVVACMKLGRL